MPDAIVLMHVWAELAGSCRWRSPLADILASVCFRINDRPLSTHCRRSCAGEADFCRLPSSI